MAIFKNKQIEENRKFFNKPAKFQNSQILKNKRNAKFKEKQPPEQISFTFNYDPASFKIHNFGNVILNIT